MTKVLFENIENELVNLLSTAKETIDIAVSWITNQKIFDVIEAKSKIGLNIRILIISDSTNNHINGLSFQNLIDSGSKIYVCQGPNLMHNKYCIIDSRVLINGSCNWTNNLDTNDENLMITEDLSILKLFQENFDFLIRKYILLNKFNKSQHERNNKNKFIITHEENQANYYDDKDLLEIYYINIEKKFVVLKFLSRKHTPNGIRIYDPPFINDRTRFVTLNKNEISQLEIGDFIVLPKDEKVQKSEYIDEAGKRQIALWLLSPELKASSFIKGSLRKR